MNYFKDFFSGKPLKINRPADDDAEWFNNSASMGDIFAYGAKHHPEFTDEQYRERILEIYKLIKTHSEETKNASDYMMCSKELGLPQISFLLVLCLMPLPTDFAKAIPLPRQKILLSLINFDKTQGCTFRSNALRLMLNSCDSIAKTFSRVSIFIALKLL